MLQMRETATAKTSFLCKYYETRIIWYFYKSFQIFGWTLKFGLWLYMNCTKKD